LLAQRKHNKCGSEVQAHLGTSRHTTSLTTHPILHELMTFLVWHFYRIYLGLL
jgi:hypothetical protein